MLTDAVLELVLPHKLESPNVVRGFHWRAWRRETQLWQMLIRTAAPSGAIDAWSLILASTPTLDKRGHYKFVEQRKKERREVLVTREVAHARRFIRDDDNLRFSTKPLNDALKRLGLVYDDDRRWMVQPAVEQTVSIDGKDRTIVRIKALSQERIHAA